MGLWGLGDWTKIGTKLLLGSESRGCEGTLGRGEVTLVGLGCWAATGVRAGLGRGLEGCLGPSQGKPRLPAQPVPGIH